MTPLLEYLQGNGTDHRGRTLSEVQAADDNFLEVEHDYIQWLFPLKEPSYNVQDAPVITDDEIEKAKADKRVQENMKKSLERMIRFYMENNHWLVPRDHNHLRITRIIKSARIILGDEPAIEFYDHIMARVHATEADILPLHLAYWTDAIGLSFDRSGEIIRAS